MWVTLTKSVVGVPPLRQRLTYVGAAGEALEELGGEREVAIKRS